MQLAWRTPTGGDLPVTIPKSQLYPPVTQPDGPPPQTGGADTLVYLHADQMGSVGAVTDAQHAIVSSQEYDPWGKVLTPSGTPVVPGPAPIVQTTRNFTGQKLDGTGLPDYNARLYDPVVGRFVSPDSVGQIWTRPQTLNRYSYVLDNPVNATDPTGHWVDPPGGDDSSGSSTGAPAIPPIPPSIRARMHPELSNKVDDLLRKVNNYGRKGFSDDTLYDAYYQETHGGKSAPGVKVKPDGTPFDHLGEAQHDLKGLKDRISDLDSWIKDSRLDPQVREYLEDLRYDLQTLANEVDYYLRFGHPLGESDNTGGPPAASGGGGVRGGTNPDVGGPLMGGQPGTGVGGGGVTGPGGGPGGTGGPGEIPRDESLPSQGFSWSS